MRMFETNRVRRKFPLDGLWDFVSDSGVKCAMPSPACWEMHPLLEKYRGKAVYSKEINLSEKSDLRLVFKGVSHTADVSFDGKLIAHHYNAFTPFDVVIADVSEGVHTISVEVDNSFNENSALHLPNDYYTYGGITRPAGYEIIHGCYIKNIHFTPSFEGGVWSGKCEVEVHNTSSDAQGFTVKINLAGLEADIPVTVSKGCIETAVWEASFNSITPWCPENPKLYEINCRLYEGGECIDDLIDRTGFRVVSVSGKDILLNGEKIFLKGFNRHEDFAFHGCAIPSELMMKDVWLMKDMGANAVRTCHYPNDERFLDICDSEGLLVWEEHHARGLNLEKMNHPMHDKQIEDCTREMVYYHYNHPSIFVWGVFNECASHEAEGRVKYKKAYEQIKSMDLSRPTTSASNKFYNDLCLDLPDIVSYNIYSGWYNTNPIKEELEKELLWISENGGGNKPFIMSEFGAAAMYGFRDTARRLWSEEGQADLLEECLKIYMNNEAVSGVFIWQFCDCRVTEESNNFLSRSCMRNNKGIVDMYRRPKLSYEVIKNKFRAKQNAQTAKNII